MSTIKKSQEQEVNDVTATEKRIKLTEVCEESTSSDDKDSDAVTITQVHFTEVTDALDEAAHFSQHHCKNNFKASVSITHKRHI